MFGSIFSRKLMVVNGPYPAPAPEAWSPASLVTGSGIYYDYSDLSMMFQDAEGTIPVTADGDPVGLVKDKSSNGNDAYQSNADYKPIYRTDGTTSCLEFDGVDDRLEIATAAFINGSAYTMVNACNYQASNRSTMHVTFGTDVADGGSADNSRIQIGWRYYDRYAIAHWANDADYSITSGVSDNGPHVETAQFRNPGSSLWLNGSYIGSNDAPTTMDEVGHGYIGSGYQGNMPWDGALYGFLLVPRVLTDDERTRTEQYMADKAGVTL